MSEPAVSAPSATTRDEAIPLRPHHLLCVLTFVGEGYSPAFAANLRSVVEHLNGGAEIRIVDGPDAVCGPRLEDPDAHCRSAQIEARDRRAAETLAPLLGGAVAPGARYAFDADRLLALRQAFADGRLRTACEDCGWSALCDRIAETDFQTALLSPDALRP